MSEQKSLTSNKITKNDETSKILNQILNELKEIKESCEE